MSSGDLNNIEVVPASAQSAGHDSPRFPRAYPPGDAGAQESSAEDAQRTESKHQEMRQKIIQELIQTERDFEKSLTVCLRTFDTTEQCPSSLDADVLFGNVADVVELSRRILTTLHEDVSSKPFDQQIIGKFFVLIYLSSYLLCNEVDNQLIICNEVTYLKCYVMKLIICKFLVIRLIINLLIYLLYNEVEALVFETPLQPPVGHYELYVFRSIFILTSVCCVLWAVCNFSLQIAPYFHFLYCYTICIMNGIVNIRPTIVNEMWIGWQYIETLFKYLGCMSVPRGQYFYVKHVFHFVFLHCFRCARRSLFCGTQGWHSARLRTLLSESRHGHSTTQKSTRKNYLILSTTWLVDKYMLILLMHSWGMMQCVMRQIHSLLVKWWLIGSYVLDVTPVCMAILPLLSPPLDRLEVRKCQPAAPWRRWSTRKWSSSHSLNIRRAALSWNYYIVQ